MLQKIIKLYYSIILAVTPSSGWRSRWRRQRMEFLTDTENLSENRKKFRKRYKAENRNWDEYKHYRRDYLICYILFCLTADEYFQYNFFEKGWKWRNHHITIERRKFIDGTVNDRSNLKVLMNKCEFNDYYKDYIHRIWCDLNAVSEEEFIEIFKPCERIILKPRGSYGGIGIEVHDADSQTLSKVYRKKRKGKYIVEEYLNQTGILHDINPDSLNSIRVTSIRKGDRVSVVDGFFRCGSGKTIVDNFSNGGIIFPYDVNTGRIYRGHSKTELNVLEHPHSRIRVEGMILPDYDRIVETIKQVHSMLPAGIDLVGWDVCVIDNKVILIEGNSKPGYTVLYDPANNLWKKMKQHF